MFFVSGRSGDSPFHEDLQLVEREHLLPHDHRKPGAGLQAVVRDLARLQDGRPPHLLHLPHAHQHEQAEDAQGEVSNYQTVLCCVAAGRKEEIL